MTTPDTAQQDAEFWKLVQAGYSYEAATTRAYGRKPPPPAEVGADVEETGRQR